MKLLKLTLLAVGATMALTVQAEVDLTSYVLTNPSFEADAASCIVDNSSDDLVGWDIKPDGWTVTTSGDFARAHYIISNTCTATDNNFGPISEMADGDYAFYQRVGWASASSTLSQTTTNSAVAGVYKLSFLTKAYHVNNATANATYSVATVDGTILASASFTSEAGSTGSMTSGEWTTHELEFTLTEGGQFTISVDVTWASGGSCIAYDDFRIYYVGAVPEPVVYYDITSDYFENPSFELDTDSWGEYDESTKYYTNTLDPINNSWAQVLPVEDWIVTNELNGSSDWAVLYSMPYTGDGEYCNYNNGGSKSDIVAPDTDIWPEAGIRCFSAVIAWTYGSIAITKELTLAAGEYKLSFLARYLKPSGGETRKADNWIYSGANNNYSLCGVQIGDDTYFYYPSTADTWEEIVIPFTLEDESTEVTVSFGVKNTKGDVGSGYNTRIYVDDVRLYSTVAPETSALDVVTTVAAAEGPVNVYNMQGRLVRRGADKATATEGLPAGVYVVGSSKVLVK